MVRLVLTLVMGVMLIAIAVPSLTGADEGDKPSNPPPRGKRGDDDRPPPPGRRPPPPPHPLETALDANDDGEISAEEIAGAVAALTKADRNGDGKLTGDEVRPPHPPHGFGPPLPRGEGRGERRLQGPPPGGEGDDRPPPRRHGGPPRE